MNRILDLKSCRALCELKGKEPLTEEEYTHLTEMAESCPLQGEHFDEVSWLYPLRIPLEPKTRILDATDHTISAFVLYNKTCCVGLIGDDELEALYLTHPGALIYAVGEIITKVKENVEYKNLRPRGWMLYPVRVKEDLDEIPKVKEKKKKGG